MIVTEDEARRLWCPHVRGAAVTNSELRYKDGAGEEWNTCIASRCSQWRWSLFPGCGYCGLAGVPQVRDKEEACE